MSASEIFELFLGGLILGHGPCLAFCAPIILPYVASTEMSWRGGLLSTLRFSAGRMISYLFLAVAASFSYAWLDSVVLEDSSRIIVKLLLAFLLLAMAVWLLAGGRGMIHPRGLLGRLTSGSPFVMGTLIGLSPCAPLLGSLAFIAAKAESPADGAVMGLAFAIGTVLSPLLILGALFGSARKLTGKSNRALLLLRIASSAILIMFALRLGFEAFSQRTGLLG